MSEHDEQVALFEWAEYMANLKWPELRFMFAVPNGGWRAKTTAGWLKAEGLKPGVPDIFLPVPRGCFHGLFIEMKFGRNQLTADQRYYAEFLFDHDYLVMPCWGFDDAQRTIERYMGLEVPEYMAETEFDSIYWKIGPREEMELRVEMEKIDDDISD